MVAMLELALDGMLFWLMLGGLGRDGVVIGGRGRDTGTVIGFGANVTGAGKAATGLVSTPAAAAGATVGVEAVGLAATAGWSIQ